MSTFSYPRPTVIPPYKRVCAPRPLLPLSQFEIQGPRPLLPSPPRRSLLDDSFVLSTHLFPGAYPRSIPDIPPPPLPKWSPNREEWKTSAKRTADALAETREKYNSGKLGRGTSKKQLWLCVNRYVRKGLKDSQGVTLFLAHANGFPKEIWEPMLKCLLDAGPSSSATSAIDEIWTWEAVNHGDSALVNGDKLGWLYDWQDNTRDILEFTLHYLPSKPSASPLPTHLECVPDSISNTRSKHGFQDRTFVAIGHSLGGATSALAAINQPQLFSSLLLIDAVIVDPTGAFSSDKDSDATTESARINNLVLSTLQRRDRWSSREDARQKLGATPFFAAWDPSVLDVYVECGLIDDGAGGVTLKTSSMQEALVFNDFLTAYEVWDLLEDLDPRVELRFELPAKLPRYLQRMRERLTWRRHANSSNIVFKNSGHLIAQEVPAELAQDIHAFLQRKYGGSQAKL